MIWSLVWVSIKVSYCYCVTGKFFYVCQCLSYILRWFYAGCIDIYNCYVLLLDWSVDHYVVSFLISCNILYLRSIFSDMRNAAPAFFCFSFAWDIFFHLLTLSLYVYLDVKLVSFRQHIPGSCFSMHSASLCFWLEYLIWLHLK